MTTEPQTTVKNLIAFLTSQLGAGTVVRYEFPEETEDMTKGLTIVRLVSTREEETFLADAKGASTSARLLTLSIAIESWVGGGMSAALDAAGTVAQKIVRQQAAFYVATGARLVNNTDAKTLPFDDKWPGWARASTWYTLQREDSW